MIVADGPETYGYTIFCDDIRFEVGGKVTYVGVYSKTLFVGGEFPFTIPTLSMDVIFLQRKRIFKPPTKFIVALPGETEENPSIAFELQAADIQKMIEAGKDIADDSLVRLGGPLSFSNLVIQKAGALKVRAVQDDKFIRLGALQVVQHPNFVQKEEAAG
jgi:hypothetical protein